MKFFLALLIAALLCSACAKLPKHIRCYSAGLLIYDAHTVDDFDWIGDAIGFIDAKTGGYVRCAGDFVIENEAVK